MQLRGEIAALLAQYTRPRARQDIDAFVTERGLNVAIVNVGDGDMEVSGRDAAKLAELLFKEGYRAETDNRRHAAIFTHPNIDLTVTIDKTL